MIRPTPVAFDFERDDEPPDWLVDGVIERGTVTVLSGDTSAGKSLIAAALSVAVLQGGTWLGREAHLGRVLYVDEENHRRLVRDRLKAFGLGNDERDGLRYYLRAGVGLGEEAWNTWLAEEALEHGADLVVIDTAAAVMAGDVNDNSRVAALYRDALRPATVGGAAVLVLHHERKHTGEHRNASQAMMGARQWAGQADAHLAVRPTGGLSNEAIDGGGSRQRFPIELETPKVRDGAPALPQRFAILSERDANNRLSWMQLAADDDPLVVGVVRFLAERKDGARRAEIGEAVGLGSKDGRLERALRAAVDAGKVEKVRHGVYAAT